MNRYDRRAGRLQDRVAIDERFQTEDIDEIEVRRAIVHARQDIVLVVSHLSSLNSQIQQLRWMLYAAFSALGIAALH
ncbi:MAG: hypothetical protein ING44_15695 [Telmatospirillum sp.]|nr:hypothetical protein [Telmatospirillum sp.]